MKARLGILTIRNIHKNRLHRFILRHRSITCIVISNLRVSVGKRGGTSCVAHETSPIQLIASAHQTSQQHASIETYRARRWKLTPLGRHAGRCSVLSANAAVSRIETVAVLQDVW